ncbi:hypothetical protein BC332_24440 [Capsicum chinense]|nr:hypothetical protein BC332_24440 [Capsicum chinense]
MANDEKTHERLSDTLQLVAEDMDRIWKESTKIQDKGEQVSQGSLVQDFSSSTNNILNPNNNMVGRDDQKERLLEDLTTSYSGEPKVIPIVGMGGIGKTTIAKGVYNHGSIICRFDVRAWATISQQHNIKKILLSLLQSTIKIDDMVKTKGEAELADMLQKSLKRKRYLIVLDDIWSCEVWDSVRSCFPTEDNAGSRMLLTTSNNEVACYDDTKNLTLRMGFMDQDESWNLFKSAAFSSEALPYEFETVGKQITDECHGLPLTIVVVAELLKSKMVIEDWESVAKDVKSFVTNDPDEQCSCVLGLSYNHLTSYLKTCLLHFRFFQKRILSLIWLRYLSLQCHENLDIPPEIYRLWNLQTLIIKEDDRSFATCPVQIWGLMQLRHLKLPRFYLPDCPCGSVDKGRHLDFSNLQTISYLSFGCCMNEVILGIHNVKNLGIRQDMTDYGCFWDSGPLNNLVHLPQLETLSFLFCFGELLPASAKAFPTTLKKLKLKVNSLSWSYLDIIADLPSLEVLKLMTSAFGIEEWYPIVGDLLN